MPNLSTVTCIEDLRVVAKRRVPRMFYDYADSGSYTEGTYRSNTADFQGIKLRQRVAVNMEGRSTRTTMVGQDVAMPVAIAPTGLTGMQHAGGGKGGGGSVLTPEAKEFLHDYETWRNACIQSSRELYTQIFSKYSRNNSGADGAREFPGN